MPWAPPHACTRCGRHLRRGARCAHCDRPRQAARPTLLERGYTPAWAPYAKAWLLRYPWCGQRADGRLHAEHSRCAAGGWWVPARVVDHIRPLRDGGALLDPANHQSLCYSCNNRKR